ncbi:MAG TPA: AraC family transcriptional regulator [Thermoanaerobaculia bacterium]|nr:AraC family transcriptional regulator [Thermoanaerobaculia bacterium]
MLRRRVTLVYAGWLVEIDLTFSSAGELPERIEELLARELAMQFLDAGRSRGPAPRPPEWVELVLDILAREYRRPVSLARLARQAGVSRSRLAHGFREATGTTVGEYLRHLRMTAAARALSESDAPIGDVALDCGFSDQAHFSRVFRAMKGMTPREWRRRARELRVTRR